LQTGRPCRRTRFRPIHQQSIRPLPRRSLQAKGRALIIAHPPPPRETEISI
jgi:hypothetical protein